MDEPSLLDDIMGYEADLREYLDNLIGYRAHLVHKHTEAAFDEEFYSKVGMKECVVVCDWKMKILSSKYRESQQEWYSKRGTSLLGFELHLTFENDKKKVLYHFFITDDTLQDAEAVLCAKHYLYTKVLPMYDIEKVHFRSDGATCYSSKESKTSMALFGDISKDSDAAYEISYKISVAGCGKTCLDVRFFLFLVYQYT